MGVLLRLQGDEIQAPLGEEPHDQQGKRFLNARNRVKKPSGLKKNVEKQRGTQLRHGAGQQPDGHPAPGIFSAEGFVFELPAEAPQAHDQNQGQQVKQHRGDRQQPPAGQQIGSQGEPILQGADFADLFPQLLQFAPDVFPSEADERVDGSLKKVCALFFLYPQAEFLRQVHKSLTGFADPGDQVDVAGLQFSQHLTPLRLAANQGVQVADQRLRLRGMAFIRFQGLELLLGRCFLLSQLLGKFLHGIQSLFQLGLPAIQLFNGGSNAKPGFFKVVDAGLGCQQQVAGGRELNFLKVEFGNQVARSSFVVLKAFFDTREVFLFGLESRLNGLLQVGIRGTAPGFDAGASSRA